jgi:hypothetical protein
MKAGLNRILLVLSVMCLAVSLFSIVSFGIEDSRRTAERAEHDRQQAVEEIQFAVDADIDHRPLYRDGIALCSAAAFLLVLFRFKSIYALLPFVAGTFLIYKWISRLVIDLSYNESYMRDSPYLLRIAPTPDWFLFSIFLVTLVICLIFVFSGSAAQRME